MHFIYDTANGILQTIRNDSENDLGRQSFKSFQTTLQLLTNIPIERQILLDSSGD
jgi:hypothetical protein